MEDAAEANRVPLGGPAAVKEVDGNDGWVALLGIRGRRGDGAGRRDGDMDVEGEASVERERLAARVPGVDVISLRGDGGGTRGVGCFPTRMVLIVVSPSASLVSSFNGSSDVADEGSCSSRRDSTADAVGDTDLRVSSNVGLCSGSTWGITVLASWSRRTAASVVASIIKGSGIVS